MEEKDKIVRRLAECLVRAIKEDKAAVIFVRVDNPTTAADGEGTLLDFNRHIRWVHLRLAGRENPLLGFAQGTRSERTVYLVTTLDDHAMQVLNDNRRAFDRNRIRCVFLVGAQDIRKLSRLAPSYWNERDLLLAWPALADTAATDEEREKSYEEGLRKGILRRIESASSMQGGYERGRALFVACRDASQRFIPGSGSAYGIRYQRPAYSGKSRRTRRGFPDSRGSGRAPRGPPFRVGLVW